MLVIGAGGLGVPVLQYLCAMGVGRVGIVDGDGLQLSNLQRQVLYTSADLGKPKASLAADRLRQLNPDIRIDAYEVMLETGNALDLIAQYDVIADATDTFAARYLINDACVILGKPWIFGAVHQYEGQISVFNYQGGPTYRCLFPKQPEASEIPDCETGGVLGIVPGLVGGRQALEIVKLLTGIGKTLSGTVLMLDFLRDTEYRMKLRPVAENLRINSLQTSYEVSCKTVNEISYDTLTELLSNRNALLWDVREPHEFNAGHLSGAASVPLSEIEACANELDAERLLIVYCQKGSRSVRAVHRLQLLQPGLTVYTLHGGIASLSQDLYIR